MRSRLLAAIGTILFTLFVGPGPVIVLIPWLLSRWQLQEPLPGWYGFRWIGAILILCGAPVLGDALVRFVREGRGTPAPVLPTEQLVVSGLYRYVRNPMYVAVLGMIVGQALFLGNSYILLYAACVGIIFHLFVRLYEEPTLRRRFGAQYEAYCREVPRWLPRLRPWEQDRLDDR